MKDNLFLGEEARERMMAGIKKVSDAVGVTMGTSGRNSIIKCIETPGYYISNDGFSIANSIRLADPLEELGREQLIEAINRANKASGDGSSTTCVLTAAILEEGIKHLKEASPMEIKRSLEACIPLIEESIKKQSRPITVDNVEQVATVSAEDEEIGKRIGEIYQKIGKDGVINWEASKLPEDSYEIGTGIKIGDSGFVTPYLNDIDTAMGSPKNEAKMKNVSVILCAQKLTNLDAMGSIFSSLNDKGESDVAIFVDEFASGVVGQLVATSFKKGFRGVLIKIPTLFRDEWWEDLSIASGATVIGSHLGVPLNSLEEKHLGRFGNIIVRKDEVIVDGMKDLKKHILGLQVNGDEDSLARAFRLNLMTARYFVGGYSESSIAYRRLKVEDAINAASEALEGGVVAGGGMGLIYASILFPGDSIGERILQKALTIPARSIIRNSGVDENKTWEALVEANKPFMLDKLPAGFNSKTLTIVDMFAAGIIDPAKVVLSAVKAAIGVAAGILTTGTVVLFPEIEKTPDQVSLIQR